MSKGTYSHSNRHRMHEPQVTNYDEVANLKGIIEELRKDKERLDWLLNYEGNYWLLSNREDIDKEMDKS